MSGFDAPSGRRFGVLDEAILLGHNDAGSFLWSDNPTYPLHDGTQSRFYAKLREEIPRALWTRIGTKISGVAYRLMRAENDLRQPCFIGVPDAGTPFAAIAMMEHTVQGEGCPPPAALRLMHKHKKKHGIDAGTWIDGRPDGARQRYFLIEQAATRGESMACAVEHYLEDGYRLRDLMCLMYLDREQGAHELLRQRFPKIVLRTLFRVRDVLAFGIEREFFPPNCRELFARESPST